MESPTLPFALLKSEASTTPSCLCVDRSSCACVYFFTCSLPLLVHASSLNFCVDIVLLQAVPAVLDLTSQCGCAQSSRSPRTHCAAFISACDTVFRVATASSNHQEKNTGLSKTRGPAVGGKAASSGAWRGRANTRSCILMCAGVFARKRVVPSRFVLFVTCGCRIVKGVDRCGIERDAVHAITCRS